MFYLIVRPVSNCRKSDVKNTDAEEEIVDFTQVSLVSG